MAGGTVALFWAVSFLFVITPGADWAYAIAAGLRHRVLLPAVGGLLVGHLADAAWPIAAQIVVLGLVHLASCAVVYTGVGTGARRVLRARPTAARAVTRFSGTAMIVIGVVLLAEQLIG